MMLLQANRLTYEIKGRVLLNINHLEIYQGDRIGLVGPNGSGKTTLLEILAQQKQGHEGSHVKLFGTCALVPQLKDAPLNASGGEITQAAINDALTTDPDVLLADEPTANLDTEHVEQLERRISHWNGAFVIVSHDRMFLDTVCTTIWELRDGKVITYKGNYSEYVAQKEHEEQRQRDAYDHYEKEKKQLEKARIMKEQQAQQATKIPKSVSPSERRILGVKTHYGTIQRKLQKTASAIEKRMDQLERVEKVKELPAIKMNLPHAEGSTGKIIIRALQIEGVIEKRTLWEKATFDVRGGDKLAIIGANGSGKTTLLKKVINHDKHIRISPSVKIGYFSQQIDQLQLDQTILENVQSSAIQDETTIRIVLARLRFIDDDVFKKIEDLSGGERVKVAFAKLFVSDINTLILDEPTNFLDIEAVEALEALLQQYEGTILFTSHDRQFVQKIATRMLSIEDQKIHVFEGTYVQFKQADKKPLRDKNEEKKLLLETKITEVLSKLSIEPSDELDAEFKALLAEKKKLDD